MDQTDDRTAEVQPGFAIVRTHPNGDIPPKYLRAFQAVGRDGLVHLTYGPRATAHVFARHGEAVDIVRRLRWRTSVGIYDYSIEKAVTPADVSLKQRLRRRVHISRAATSRYSCRKADACKGQSHAEDTHAEDKSW